METFNKFPINVKNTIPKNRQEILRLHGWGFKDTEFKMGEKYLTLTGNRYIISNAPFRKAREQFKYLLDVDINDSLNYKEPVHQPSEYPPAIENKEFLSELSDEKIDFSSSFDDRFFRCHGQGYEDLYILLNRKFQKIPDVVVWPKSHENVVKIVALANKYLAVVVPFAGGTNTTQSTTYQKENERFLISLDMTQMNRILWIDGESMLACIESGIVGKDMEMALEKEGFIVGHEPDSIEFSTLGGWIATRSSGMKQQKYGNIEDIVKKITLVTSIGVMEKSCLAPRVSIGPDFNQVVIGSEGTLGVITNVVVKIHKAPPVKEYGSIIFPNFELGVKFMQEVSKLSMKPTNIRLIDNMHIQMGIALEPHKNFFTILKSNIQKTSLHYLFGYNLWKISFAIYIIDGEKDEVEFIKNKMKDLIKKYYGKFAGEYFGRHGYGTTSAICYTRDFVTKLGYITEAFETSITWEKCWPLICVIRNVWEGETSKRKLKSFVTTRISQIYNNGVCVYLYAGIGPTGNRDQLEVFEELAAILRKAITRCGGSLSHHLGIGKKNMKYYPEAVSHVGVELFKSIKTKLDPNNIFDVSNMIKVNASGKL